MSHLIHKVQTWVRGLAKPFVRSLAPCIILLCANVQGSSACEFGVSSSRVIVCPPVTELRIVPLIGPHASDRVADPTKRVSPLVERLPARPTSAAWPAAHPPVVFFGGILQQSDHQVSMNGEHVLVLSALKARQSFCQSLISSLISHRLLEAVMPMPCLYGID